MMIEPGDGPVVPPPVLLVPPAPLAVAVAVEPPAVVEVIDVSPVVGVPLVAVEVPAVVVAATELVELVPSVPLTLLAWVPAPVVALLVAPRLLVLLVLAAILPAEPGVTV